MNDYRLETIDLTGAAVENQVLKLGAKYRTITVTQLDGLVQIRPSTAAQWIPLRVVGQVVHFGTPTDKLYYKKAAGLSGTAELFISLDGSWIQVPAAAPSMVALDSDEVTPDDNNDLAPYASGLYIGGAGDVNITTPKGTDVKYEALPAGTVLPIGAKRVKQTGTTATKIVAMRL